MSSIELSAVEDLLEDLNKSLTAQDEERVSSVEILAKGSDAIISQNNELIEMIQKSLDSFGDKLDGLNDRLDQLENIQEKVEKSFNDLASEPVQKSIFSAEAVPSPSEVVENNETADTMRVAELRRAVSRLESNFAPSQIAQELGY